MLAVCVHAPSQKGAAGICRRTQLPPNKKTAWEKTPQGIPEDLYNFPELKGMHTIWILG